MGSVRGTKMVSAKLGSDFTDLLTHPEENHADCKTLQVFRVTGAIVT